MNPYGEKWEGPVIEEYEPSWEFTWIFFESSEDNMINIFFGWEQIEAVSGEEVE